jgi:hypothetical protein
MPQWYLMLSARGHRLTRFADFGPNLWADSAARERKVDKSIGNPNTDGLAQTIVSAMKGHLPARS